MLLSVLLKDESKLLQISLNLPLEILDVLVRDHVLLLFLLLLRGHNGRPIEQLLGAILLSPSSSYSSHFCHFIESQRSIRFVVEFEVQS